MEQQTKPFKPVINHEQLVRLSLGLLALALLIIGYLIFLLNRPVIKPAESQVSTQAFQNFIEQQFQLARYDKTFELRQRYYSQFMAALADGWYALSRQNQEELAESLHQLAKAYYGLEPFLDASGRHQLKKRIALFQRTMNRLSADAVANKPVKTQDKQAVNELIDELQEYLYPLLFQAQDQ